MIKRILHEWSTLKFCVCVWSKFYSVWKIKWIEQMESARRFKAVNSRITLAVFGAKSKGIQQKDHLGNQWQLQSIDCHRQTRLASNIKTPFKRYSLFLHTLGFMSFAGESWKIFPLQFPSTSSNTFQYALVPSIEKWVIYCGNNSFNNNST